MNSILHRHIRQIALTLLLGGAAAACAKDAPAPAVGPAEQPAHTMAPLEADPSAQAGLHRIEDPSQVCMVTNQFMGTPQIPVEVEGKTYFGCCPMCKGRLETEPETRTATDPGTGETIDKATAVLVQDDGGAVLYFASEQSYLAYASR